MPSFDPAQLLKQMFDAAVAAADPAKVVPAHLPQKPKGRCVVVGAGKAACAMARAVEIAWPDVDISGAVVTPYGHEETLERVEVMQASHPVPDEGSVEAAQRLLSLAASAGPDDLVLALISGGGSALLALAKPPLTLEDKIAVNKALLHSGLRISDMNKVRRRISKIKGGGLLRAATSARVVTLAISDVPGDDPADIASGPTVLDPSSGDDLTVFADKLGDTIPEAARKMLLEQASVDAVSPAEFRLVATPQASLEAAAAVAQAAGVTPLILGDSLEGEARELGSILAGVSRSVARHGTPVTTPAVLLSGGETTVSISEGPAGRGGRNTEFLLSLAKALDGQERIFALAADTDGIDGTEDAAGAVIFPDTLERAGNAGCDASTHLARHDSYSFFDAIGALVKTGPTRTNVNDFRAILVM